MIEITILGTTAGIPTRERSHPAIALRYEGEILLFDCGENTQRQMIFANLSPMKISSILLTHWHADHFAGLPGLIQSLSLRERKNPLYIYGPEGTKKFVNTILSLGYFTKTFEIIVREINQGIVVEKEKYRVEAVPVKHSIPTLSYKFSEKEKLGRFDIKKAKKLGLKPVQFGILQMGKSVKIGDKIIKPEQVLGPKRKGLCVVYSGDTGYSKELIEFSKGADLLIHESTFASNMEKYAIAIRHVTAKQAAEIAKKAKVKKLVLTHISGRYKNAKPLLEEAKKVFKNTTFAKDLMKIVLK